MDAKRVRELSVYTANALGIAVSARVPLLDNVLEVRSTEETIARILAMNAVAAIAYGFDRMKVIAWLTQEALSGALGEKEKRFVLGGAGEPETFRVQVEGMWALAWAIGIANEMDFTKDCDGRFVMTLPNLKQGQSSAAFRRKANPRPPEELLAACDLAYCLHWAIRQTQLTGKRFSGGVKPYVVVARRRALEWLLGTTDAWDEVSLDT